MDLHRPEPPTPEPPRVLLADADTSSGPAIVHALASAGFRVDRVRHAHELAAVLLRAPFDAVLLGTALPGGAPLELVQSAQPAPLVVALLDTSDAAERIRWLERGVDDLVALPVEAEEVVARVRAVLRRTLRARTASVVLRHGPLCLEVERRTATWQGREVQLTGREFWLLETLVRRRHEVVSRAMLEGMLCGWGDEASSNTVEVHVHHLRRKIDRRLITTVRGSGYRIGAEDGLVG